jgi:hypothetical protein
MNLRVNHQCLQYAEHALKCPIKGCGIWLTKTDMEMHTKAVHQQQDVSRHQSTCPVQGCGLTLFNNFMDRHIEQMHENFPKLVRGGMLLPKHAEPESAKSPTKSKDDEMWQDAESELRDPPTEAGDNELRQGAEFELPYPPSRGEDNESRQPDWVRDGIEYYPCRGYPKLTSQAVPLDGVRLSGTATNSGIRAMSIHERIFHGAELMRNPAIPDD